MTEQIERTAPRRFEIVVEIMAFTLIIGAIIAQSVWLLTEIIYKMAYLSEAWVSSICSQLLAAGC